MALAKGQNGACKKTKWRLQKDKMALAKGIKVQYIESNMRVSEILQIKN